jgi:hypothetical protein
MPGPVGQAGAAASFRLRNAGPAALAVLAWIGAGSPVWGCTTTSGDQVPPRPGTPPSESDSHLGSGPVSRSYLNWNLQRHGVSLECIRRDRVLHEALTARADPLHLALVFSLSQTTASKYTLIAYGLLDGQPAEGAEA